jgi:hypothetical protein
MKGEQTMKKVNLNEYAAICRAARRGNLIAKMRVKNVEVDNDNELVKLVAESLKKSSDFFATLCCTDPNVGTTAIGKWAESVWKQKDRGMELAEIRYGNWFVSGLWIFAHNQKQEQVLAKEQERFIRSLARLMKDLEDEATKLGIKVKKGLSLDSLRFSI